MTPVGKKRPDGLSERLAAGGLRLTSQRRRVYDVLLEKRDHPTAEEVFIRAKRRMPEISLATVYNCLDALVRAGVARQVSVDRGAARFCPNMREHCHFCCEICGSVFDIELPADTPVNVTLPKRFRAARYEVAIHGVCGRCAGRRSARPVASRPD